MSRSRASKLTARLFAITGSTLIALAAATGQVTMNATGGGEDSTTVLADGGHGWIGEPRP